MASMDWPMVPISDLQSSKRWALNGGPFGSKLVSRDYVESGVPVIRGANLPSARRFSFQDFVFVTEKKADELLANNAHPGDVVFTQRGTLGQVGIIPKTSPFPRFVISQSQMKITVDDSRVDAEWLFYCFRDPSTQQEMINRASSSGVPHINLGVLRDFQLRLPRLHEQRRIASVLSAYDDMIENNMRRIAILEEMARGIYEEWFVRFRFPGHEGVRMVESELGPAPKGWELTDLKAVCVAKNGIQTGPFGSQLHKADYTADGVPVLMPKDLIGFRIRTETIARIPEEKANQLARHRMRPGDIAYGRRGDIGRRAYIMEHQAGWFCGTGCLRIRPDPEKISGWYLFNFIGQESVAGLIAGRAHGVTMPNLNARLMESIPVIRPPRKLQNKFEQTTLTMFVLRERLNAQNQHLRTTRDLLLPKLISGELDVSELPEAEAIAA